MSGSHLRRRVSPPDSHVRTLESTVLIYGPPCCPRRPRPPCWGFRRGAPVSPFPRRGLLSPPWGDEWGPAGCPAFTKCVDTPPGGVSMQIDLRALLPELCLGHLPSKSVLCPLSHRCPHSRPGAAPLHAKDALSSLFCTVEDGTAP